MHWFDSQIKKLYKLAEDYEACLAKDSDTFVDDVRLAQTAFVNKIQFLVDSVVKLPDVTGCVAEYEGFILAIAGSVGDSDALGAIMQECMEIAKRSGKLLTLGTIQQVVIVGENNKIAMISVGQVSLCIFSDKQSNLAESLSQKPE